MNLKNRLLNVLNEIYNATKDEGIIYLYDVFKKHNIKHTDIIGHLKNEGIIKQVSKKFSIYRWCIGRPDMEMVNKIYFIWYKQTKLRTHMVLNNDLLEEKKFRKKVLGVLDKKC